MNHNIVQDFKMFECARDDAAYILAHQDEADFRYILKTAKESIEESPLK